MYAQHACVLRIVPGAIFNRTNPILLGADVLSGTAEVGMRLRVPSSMDGVGRIAALEINTRSVQVARVGQRVALKIDVDPLSAVESGRGDIDLDADDVLVSDDVLESDA